VTVVNAVTVEVSLQQLAVTTTDDTEPDPSAHRTQYFAKRFRRLVNRSPNDL